MESWAISERADVHHLEVAQAFPEVLETYVVSIHHFPLITAAAKIPHYHFPHLSLRKKPYALEVKPGANDIGE